MEGFFEAIRELIREYWVQILLGILANLVAAIFILTFSNWRAALCMVAVALMFVAIFVVVKMVSRADEM